MRLLAALAAGALSVTGFAPLGWWPVALAMLAVLHVLARAAPPRRAALLGFAWGLGAFVAGISWVYVSMHRYGGMPAPLAGTATLAFAAYLALFPAAACAVFARLRTGRFVADTLAFAGAFTLAELVRGWLLTGFPWLSVGYAHTDSPLAGWAPVAGVYGVGFMAACCAAGLSLAAFSIRGALVFALPLVLGSLLQLPAWSTPHGEPLRVRLVQGNVPQQMKFDPQRVLQDLHHYVAQIEASDAPLVVLPETAWAVPWQNTPPELAERLARHARATGTRVALGLPWVDGPAYSNAVLLLENGQPAARYDKHHLVPFGEFVPWGFRWFVNLMRMPLGDFARGAPAQPPFLVAGQRVAMNVCYEDLFGEELLPALRGPRSATVLVNVSNIGWFGDSLALPQHLQISRMRALETARPMLRATNTGVTAHIDARGQVVERLPHFTRQVLDVTVQGHAGLTPYARTGNLPVALVALAVLAWPLAARRRRVPAR